MLCFFESCSFHVVYSYFEMPLVIDGHVCCHLDVFGLVVFQILMRDKD